MVSERAEAERELVLLRTEAERISKILGNLSGALRTERFIKHVEFDGEDLKQSPPYPGFRQDEYTFESSQIDGQKIKQLCKEIRELEATTSTLSQRLKVLGV
jgi:hypothetical protein